MQWQDDTACKGWDVQISRLNRLIHWPRGVITFAVPLVLGVVLAMCFAFAGPSTQERFPRFALLIGNSNYPDGGAPLPTPIKDAHTLADQIRNLDFTTTLKENVGKVEMRAAIDDFVSKVTKGSVVLVYYSGLGLQAAGQTYLIPVDANVWSEADVQRDAVSIKDVVAQLHDKGARAKIIVVDAAYRNPFERRFRNVPAGLATLEAPVGTLAIFSTAPGRRAAETTGDSSVFATELSKALQTPDRPIESIFNETRTAVSRNSKNEQVPWVSSSLTEELRLAPQAPAPTPTPAAPVVAAKPTPAPAAPTAKASPAAPTTSAPAVATQQPPAAAPATPSPAPAAADKKEAAVAPTADQPKSSGTVRQVFEKHKLIGVFAWNCDRPPSDSNWYTMNRVVSANRIEQTILTAPSKRPYVTEFDQATDLSETSVSVGGTRSKQPVTGVWQLEDRRMLEFEAVTNGKTEIASAKRVRDGLAVPWATKCSP